MKNKSDVTSAKKWQLVAYPLVPAVSNLFMIFFMMSAYIANGGYGLAMAVAASVRSVSNIFDAITDPLVAVIVPKINSKYGAARPIIIVGYLLMALSTVGMAFVFPGKGAAFYVICYMGYILGRTILGQGKNLASNILTKNPKQRPVIGRYSVIYSLVLGSLLSLYRSKILYPKYGSLNLALLQELGGTAVVIGLVFVILGCLALKDADTQENIASNYNKKVKISLVDLFKMAKTNKAFLAGMISDASDKLANEVATAAIVVTMLFGILINNYEFSGSISLVTMLTSIILIFTVTGKAKKIGAGKAYVMFTKMACGVLVVLFIFMVSGQLANVTRNPLVTVIFVLIYAALSAGKTTTNSCVVTMYQDISDYEYYLTGKYMPGLVVSGITMVGKLMKALGDLLVGVLIMFAGYTTTAPQPGDPATPAVFWVTVLMFIGLPLFGWVTSIIAMHWYPLTPEKMVEVQAANAERRARNKADNSNDSGLKPNIKSQGQPV